MSNKVWHVGGGRDVGGWGEGGGLRGGEKVCVCVCVCVRACVGGRVGVLVVGEVGK